MTRFGIVSLVVIPILLSNAAPALAQTIKLATIAPEGSSWMIDMRSGAKAIENATDGRV